MSTVIVNNPLLGDVFLPEFDLIKAEHFLPAINQLIEDGEASLEQVLANATTPTWQNLLHCLEEIDDRLNRAWSTISHLNGVCNTEEIRQAYSECLPVLTDYSTRMGQHRPLFNACKQLKDSVAYSSMNKAQRKTLDNKLRDFQLAGVDLNDELKKQYADIKSRLAELTAQFSNNVLDATQGWHYQITDVKELGGLPESSIAAAQVLAEQKEMTGYVISLDMPSYLPVMQYCNNRELRALLYKAYVTRASELSDSRWDNSAIMEEILSLKQQLAKLLGFKNYADYSIATKMAASVDEVFALLDELAGASLSIAKNEYQQLAKFAEQNLGLNQLEAWDIAYATEALRLARYELSQETLRAYFPADTVINGLFEIINRLYGVEVTATAAPSVWHQDVRFYQLARDGKVFAQCYLDLFARDGKRGGAWMADCRVRRETLAGQTQLPVAFLICNFSPPTKDKPSLLTHNEVTTLFHEFGHGLHHMLTKVNCADVSGINGVAWDAVELPSQFMENWCWEPEALALFSGHYETAEPLPTSLLEKMLAARNFHSAMQMLRQLEFAQFDLTIHRDCFVRDDGVPGSDAIQAVLTAVRAGVGVYPTPEFNRFQNSFQHIFAGGYAAGYYSYKWAEVLSSDAFSLFEERGVFDASSGEKFLVEILEQGGSEEPAELFKRFRGRAPSTGPLLRHAGIA